MSQVAGSRGGTVSPRPELVLQAHVRPFDRLSANERQPFSFNNGSVLTWDGRIDNREDLLINLHRDVEDDISDPSLVAAAYARWGLEAFPRLIGDWSLAIWDGAEQRLVLARDYMGNRPLYFHQTSDGLAWATQRDALATCFDLYDRPDDAFITGALTFGPPPERTPFDALRRLLAGHMLVANRENGLSIRRYWTFRPAVVRYRQAHEYADHLRYLLTEAVRVRLRADRPVWAHLSGGWDSSSVVCLAHRLTQHGLVEAPSLKPISRLLSSAPESEERRFMTAVERWCGLRAVQCDTPPFPTFTNLLARRHPITSNFEVVDDSVRDVVRTSGDFVLMTGSPGDIVMLRTARMALLEPLSSGHPLEFLQLCSARAKQGRRWTLTVLAGLAAEVALPAGMRAAARRFVTRFRWQPKETPPLFGVPEAVLRRVTPVHRTLPTVSDFPRLRRATVTSLYQFAETHGAVSTDLMPDIWYTHPYSHRPLVEFVLAAPQLAFWHPVIYRAGMQRALSDVLPPEILTRTGKGGLLVWLTRCQREQVDAFLTEKEFPWRAEDWLLVQRGYLDVATLARALAVTRAGVLRELALHDQWVCLEAWLRRLERRRPSDSVAGAPQPAMRHAFDSAVPIP